MIRLKHSSPLIGRVVRLGQWAVGGGRWANRVIYLPGNIERWVGLPWRHPSENWGHMKPLQVSQLQVFCGVWIEYVLGDAKNEQ